MSHSPKKLPDAALELIAGRFKALSEAVRLKLIMVLQTGEKNVSELVRATGKGQTSVSRHLQQLVDAGVLARRREGTCVFYRIVDPATLDLCHHVCGSLERQFAEKGKVSALFKI